MLFRFLVSTRLSTVLSLVIHIFTPPVENSVDIDKLTIRKMTCSNVDNYTKTRKGPRFSPFHVDNPGKGCG